MKDVRSPNPNEDRVQILLLYLLISTLAPQERSSYIGLYLQLRTTRTIEMPTLCCSVL